MTINWGGYTSFSFFVPTLSSSLKGNILPPPRSSRKLMKRRQTATTTSPSCSPISKIAKMPPAANTPPPKTLATAPADRAPFPLTDLEQRLFTLLLDVVRSENIPDLTLRIAGGWVRDKILCPRADLGTAVDIDIALDTMLGRDFAERVNSYLAKHNMHKASVGLIQKNPDQSKHLETATMRVLDVWLDLVNLRTETYSHDSRIPDVAIGTPLEDAMRRDLTINALFYNINTAQLEDHTGRGFDDIRARIVRTPLPPLTTLLDDPLRALRAVRFASRLNFSFDPILFAACRDPRVHIALGAKVSRERVFTEIDRIMASKNPVHAIGLLVELSLFQVVFRLPPDADLISEPRPPADLPQLALGALQNLRALPEPKCHAPQRLLRYAVLLSPIAACRCLYADSGKRQRPNPVALRVLRGELRLAAKDAAEVVGMHTAALQLTDLVHRGATQLDRLETGKAIRAAGPAWRSALQVALVMELAPGRAAESYMRGFDEGGDVGLSGEMRVLVEVYDAFQKRVEEMGLDGVWNVGPVVDGNELMKLLPRLKRGPVIGKIMGEQIDWIISHPKDGADGVRKMLMEKYAEFAKT